MLRGKDELCPRVLYPGQLFTEIVITRAEFLKSYHRPLSIDCLEGLFETVRHTAWICAEDIVKHRRFGGLELRGGKFGENRSLDGENETGAKNEGAILGGERRRGPRRNHRR